MVLVTMVYEARMNGSLLVVTSDLEPCRQGSLFGEFDETTMSFLRQWIRVGEKRGDGG